MFKHRLPHPMILALIAAGSLTQPLCASGFQLREQSAALQGTAFAGASAGAQDISSIFFNPATLSLFPGTNVELSATYIGVHMDLKNAGATRAPSFEPNQQAIAGGVGDLPNAVNQPIVPSLYLGWTLGEAVSVGLSVNAPFGFITNYPDNFVGRYYGLETNLKIIDIAPVMSVKLGKEWTVGAAFVARRSTAVLSEGVDFGGVAATQGVPGTAGGVADGKATLSANAWSYGYKVGVTWQAADTFRIGAGYQSADNVKFSGSVAYSGVPAALASVFSNGGGSTVLNLPSTASIGFTWDITRDFSLQGEAAQTGWSTFKTLDIKFASGNPDEIDPENWKNTTFMSLGGIYKTSDQWAFKAGVASDQTPVSDAYRTPRIPDANRTWVSLGTAWSPSKATTVDFGVTKVIAKSVTLNLVSGTTPASPNYYKGNLSGSYDVGATVVAISVRHKF